MILSEKTKDKIKGCIYGQAIGDALGLGSEFMSKTDVERYYPDGLCKYDQIIQDYHRRRWEKGSWTDDTDMMLCIARARIKNHFDISRIAQNFKDWFNSKPLGIGRHTYNVLSLADYTQNPMRAADIVWQLSRGKNAANGALMRTSILATSPIISEKEIADICHLTHPDSRCMGSCVLIVKVIQNLIFQNTQLNRSALKDIAVRYDHRIDEYIEKALDKNLSALSLDDQFMGYTLKTMAAALWCMWHCNCFEDGLLAIVNQGGDADTNAAVSCALLGAKYGFSNIPQYYTDNLRQQQTLEDLYKKILIDLESL